MAGTAMPQSNAGNNAFRVRICVHDNPNSATQGRRTKKSPQQLGMPTSWQLEVPRSHQRGGAIAKLFQLLRTQSELCVWQNAAYHHGIGIDLLQSLGPRGMDKMVLDILWKALNYSTNFDKDTNREGRNHYSTLNLSPTSTSCLIVCRQTMAIPC